VVIFDESLGIVERVESPPHLLSFCQWLLMILLFIRLGLLGLMPMEVLVKHFFKDSL